jgi:hypothetical protein
MSNTPQADPVEPARSVATDIFEVLIDADEQE